MYNVHEFHTRNIVDPYVCSKRSQSCEGLEGAVGRHQEAAKLFTARILSLSDLEPYRKTR
jgi:hypothetical protein